MTALLELKNVTKHYQQKSFFIPSSGGKVEAVNNISFQIQKGQSIGMIGESGCGKTTLAKIAVGLEKPTGGQVLYRGEDIYQFNFSAMQKVRKHIQIIFQNSRSTFNPYYTVGKSLQQVLENFENLSPKEYRRKVAEMLEWVGLDPSFADRFPEKLSGGQRQRANIARALIVKPELIICDEPVASLDFSIRKKILDLLKGLICDFGLTCLFISHDISTVSYACQKIAVMYRGTIVEILNVGPHGQLDAAHPYTRMLLDSIPASHPKLRKKRHFTDGSSCGTAQTMGSGCCFYSRCADRHHYCIDHAPALKDIGRGHYAACFQHMPEQKRVAFM